MASVSTPETLSGWGAGAARPYAPSWVDYLTDGVRRLPVPAWLVYLALAAGAVLFVTALAWSDGLYPVGSFTPVGVLSALTPVYALALMHYLDDWAMAALARFRLALSVAEEEYARLRYQFTTLPARPALVASLVGGLFGLSLPLTSSPTELQQMGFPTSPVLFVLELPWATLGYACAALLVYHTIRQLRMVGRIYTTQTRIDLFQLGPWYALSELTARTAIGFGLIVYAWAAVNATTPGQEARLLDTLFFSPVIALAFILPLLGAHRLLQQEKERLKAEASQLLKAILAEMNRRVAAGDFAAMAGTTEALESMLKQQSVLDKIPTWPWQAETVRGLAAALLLPLVLWFITRVLERFVVF